MEPRSTQQARRPDQSAVNLLGSILFDSFEKKYQCQGVQFWCKSQSVPSLTHWWHKKLCQHVKFFSSKPPNSVA